jgi:uncharacterized protein (TIGR03086 family)
MTNEPQTAESTESADSSPLDLLDRALAQVASVLDVACVADPSASTPCRSWNVDLLVRHVVDDLTQFDKAATGGRATFAKVAPEVEGDRPAAFRTGATTLMDTWRAADLSGTVKLPIGEVPARFIVDQQVAEFTVHAWDLAVATGQQTSGLDVGLAEASLTWAANTLRPEFRGAEEEGKSFGPEVEVAPDASAYERLAGFFGREV